MNALKFWQVGLLGKSQSPPRKRGSRLIYRHPLMFQPPPQAEDGPKEEQSKVADGGGTDSKHSTHHILIPTRYLGISFCLKGES